MTLTIHGIKFGKHAVTTANNDDMHAWIFKLIGPNYVILPINPDDIKVFEVLPTKPLKESK